MARKTFNLEPIFISKSEIIHHLGISCLETIDEWIAEGRFPPPHDRPGRRHMIWLRKHWNAYVANGQWPKAAWGDQD